MKKDPIDDVPHAAAEDRGQSELQKMVFLRQAPMKIYYQSSDCDPNNDKIG